LKKSSLTNSKGVFSTIGLTIGKILDTPVIDTSKKKNKEKDANDMSEAA
jgi:hypothetical protein